jgi:hypothetical protein
MLILLLFGTSFAAKIGIIIDTSPSSWQYLFKQGSAINIAHDRLIVDGVLKKDFEIRYYIYIIFIPLLRA